MTLLSFLWRRLTSGAAEDGRGDPELALGMKRLRHAADLNFAQAAEAHRRYLDNIEQEQAARRVLSELVVTMSRMPS